MDKWLKEFKNLVWIAGVVAVVVLWVMQSINASAEKVEKSVKLYVDTKHQSVENELKNQREVLNRIDDRVFKLLKYVK